MSLHGAFRRAPRRGSKSDMLPRWTVRARAHFTLSADPSPVKVVFGQQWPDGGVQTDRLPTSGVSRARSRPGTSHEPERLIPRRVAVRLPQHRHGVVEVETLAAPRGCRGVGIDHDARSQRGAADPRAGRSALAVTSRHAAAIRRVLLVRGNRGPVVVLVVWMDSGATGDRVSRRGRRCRVEG